MRDGILPFYGGTTGAMTRQRSTFSDRQRAHYLLWLRNSRRPWTRSRAVVYQRARELFFEEGEDEDDEWAIYIWAETTAEIFGYGEEFALRMEMHSGNIY